MSSQQLDLKPPHEVLDDMPFQAVDPIPDDEYQRLARDIRERGVIQPIVTDENGTILDGHHRAAIVEQLDLDESKEPDYVVIGDLEKDRAKLARAIKTNLLGRDVDSGAKSNAVEQYIEQTWPTDEQSGALAQIETQQEVAEKLGVDQSVVSRVLNSMQRHIIKHDRLKTREYYRENPDASYREVSRQVDASNPTVTEWLKEDFDEGESEDSSDSSDDNQTSLTATATSKEKAQASQEVFKQAKKGVSAAQEQAEKTAKGETDPSEAKERVELEKSREKNRQADSKVQQKSNQDLRDEFDVSVSDMWVANGSATHKIYCGDSLNGEILEALIGGGVDIAYIDPPYGVDEDTNRGEKKREGLTNNYDFPEVKGDKSTDIAVESHRVLSNLNIPLMIYWGANNYAHKLPPSKGWIVWDKRDGVESDDNSDFELAWTNQDRACRMHRHLWKGAIKASENNQRRIHPTQKPIALSEWVINDYARQEVDSVLDPFVGSGSTLVAAENCGVDSYGVELSPEYVAATLKRLQENGCEILRGEL